MTHFFLYRLPFNWRTPLGFIVVLLYQILVAYLVGLLFIPILCFLVGSCFLLKIFVEDTTKDLNRLNMSKMYGNNKEVKEIFCNIAQDFSNLKQLSIFANIIEEEIGILVNLRHTLANSNMGEVLKFDNFWAILIHLKNFGKKLKECVSFQQH